MIQLPKNKQKRNQLLAALAGTLIVPTVLGIFLVSPQYAKLKYIQKQTADTREHLKSIEGMIQLSNASSNALSQVTTVLSATETDMATGDIYAWAVDNVRHFKADYKVEVPEIGQPTVGDVDLFSAFPYKQFKFSMHGSGYYHDIGRFIADLEDKFPHMRVVNLEITPAGIDGEKLTFSVDIVALVKSSS
jgi:hypothetical protein